MKWKKRWMALGLLVAVVAFSGYHLKQDRLLVRTILAHSNQGDAAKTLALMEEHRFVVNPLVNIYYQIKRRQFRARFVEMEEEFEPISSNQKVEAIVSLYRQYWKDKLLQRPGDHEAAFLHALALLVREAGSSEQGVAASEDPDVLDGEVLALIRAEGLFAASFLLNGTYGLKIWAKQVVENHHIPLPDESVDVEVVRITEYLLRGYSHYATCGTYSDGGWVASDNRVYCNADAYDFQSEQFLISFLRHEGLHFVDIRDYPNLSSADLEYRAKLVELMYSTEGRVYTLLEEFALNASSEDRAFAHAYANAVLLQNLARKLMDTDFTGAGLAWQKIPGARINAAAKELYAASRERLAKEPLTREVI